MCTRFLFSIVFLLGVTSVAWGMEDADFQSGGYIDTLLKGSLSAGT
jgi:hypothetical protein